MWRCKIHPGHALLRIGFRCTFAQAREINNCKKIKQRHNLIKRCRTSGNNSGIDHRDKSFERGDGENVERGLLTWSHSNSSSLGLYIIKRPCRSFGPRVPRTLPTRTQSIYRVATTTVRHVLKVFHLRNYTLNGAHLQVCLMKILINMGFVKRDQPVLFST